MKKIIIVSIAVIAVYAASQACGCGSCSKAKSTTENISNEGIQFFTGSWNDALKKSVTENKPIFLDVSTSWCGWCKKLKRTTFSDKEAGTYFNTNFINVAIDAEKGEGISIAQKYVVSSFPTLIVIDKNEKVVLHSAGYLDADGLIQFGKQALSQPK